MSNAVKIIECPRDAWQSLPKVMPPEVKADYLRILIAAGFKQIDAVSFLAKDVMPQMADSERVLEYLDPPDDTEIIALVTNEDGAKRAAKTGAIQTLAFPYSLSPRLLKTSQNQTPEESLEALEAVGTLAYKGGMEVVAYLSMAFGNPYGEDWSIDEVVAACDLLVDCGVQQIVLADTTGLASPKLVAEVLSDIIAVHDRIEIGVHLHARAELAAAKIEAAYGAGCRRFDSSIGGIGGAPLADDLLVTNIATETLIAELKRLGAELPDMRPLDGLISAAAAMEKKFGVQVQ
ncbi:hydroxymethylglutaryl-CoA lyase [Granulicella rosea]|uniref:Hydroxymethylglutaryl-CoA lyase n=1 Tax=Granulicella rosea TaxID=474952 RepID=A0A239ICL9_9BACT|nr:hydroxymethylglutaryl-CoA lyase [Granulicella rosea]SNS91321.1 hydroxymethylglutaryl-CoA lyase [Granulicella rosea]